MTGKRISTLGQAYVSTLSEDSPSDVDLWLWLVGSRQWSFRYVSEQFSLASFEDCLPGGESRHLRLIKRNGAFSLDVLKPFGLGKCPELFGVGIVEGRTADLFSALLRETGLGRHPNKAYCYIIVILELSDSRPRHLVSKITAENKIAL